MAYCEGAAAQVSTLNYDELAQQTEGFSGSDLREACRAAAVTTVHEYLQEESQRTDGR